MGLYPRIETSHLANQLRGLRSNNWYVHGADGDDNSPGDRPEKPFATLQAALDACSNGDYDTIFVTRGVVTGETTPFLLNKANVRIVGDPTTRAQSSTNCAIIATGDTDCFTFQAADVSIEGFALYAGATSAGVGFAELAWSQRDLIERCSFMGGAFGVYSASAVDQPGHHLVIQDCHFNAAGGTTNAIRIGSNGSWPIIRRNFFDSQGVPQILITGGNGIAAGLIEDNIFLSSTDVEGCAITLTANAVRFVIKDNICNDNDETTINANPYHDAGTTNIWFRNVKGGGAGFTDVVPA